MTIGDYIERTTPAPQRLVIDVIHRPSHDTATEWAFTVCKGEIWYDCTVRKSIVDGSFYRARQHAKRLGERAFERAFAGGTY